MTRPVSILTSEGEEVRSERDPCRVRRREVMDSGGHDPRGAPVAHPGDREQAGIYQLPGANHKIFFTPSTRRHPPLKTRGSTRRLISTTVDTSCWLNLRLILLC